MYKNMNEKDEYVLVPKKSLGKGKNNGVPTDNAASSGPVREDPKEDDSDSKKPLTVAGNMGSAEVVKQIMSSVSDKNGVKVFAPDLAKARLMALANAEPRMLKKFSMGGKTAGGFKHMRTSIALNKQSATSASNTAKAVTFQLQPALSNEFATLAALFSDIRVLGFDLYADVTVVGSSTTGSAAIFTYETEVDSALTSVPNGLENRQHLLISVPIVSSSSVITACNAVSKNGFFKWSVRIPQQSAMSNTGGTTVVPNFVGQWASLLDTSDSFGAIQYYSEATAGGSATVNAIWYTVLHIEVRQRL